MKPNKTKEYKFIKDFKKITLSEISKKISIDLTNLSTGRVAEKHLKHAMNQILIDFFTAYIKYLEEEMKQDEQQENDSL